MQLTLALRSKASSLLLTPAVLALARVVIVSMWVSTAHADMTLKQNEWVQLVVPGNSDLLTVEGIFAEALGADRIDEDWSAFLLDKSTQQYIRLALNDSIPQGEAIWISQITVPEVTIPFPDPTLNPLTVTDNPCSTSNGCVVVELATLPGVAWTMVGQPFKNNPALRSALVVLDGVNSICSLGCTLEQARTEGLISELFSYNAAAARYDIVDDDTPLDAWQGFWIGVAGNAGSGSASLFMPAPVPPEMPLAAPANIEVLSHTADSVTVGWAPVSDARLHSYNLALNGTYAGYTSVEETQFTFHGLSPGVTYSFGVRSVEVPAEIYTSLTSVPFSIPTTEACAGAERYHTATVDGDLHAFVDVNGSPQMLNGVNVRSPLFSNNFPRYTQADFDAIATKGFDHIRLVLEWYRFEPVEGNVDEERLTGLDEVIGRAKTADLGVILDPIHLSNASSVGSNARGIPAWAWGAVVPDADGKKVFAELVDHALPYLRKMATRYCEEPAVIAIDLVNEPRESENGESLSVQNPQLISLYADWIGALRAIDSNKPLMIEPFYGSAKVNGAEFQSLQQFDNIIWSVHDYYAGEGTPADGYTAGGYPNRNAPRTESHSSIGNYPLVSREAARADMIKHISIHQAAASSAGIPLHIGEYGIPRGWGTTSRYDFLCDKTQIYSELKVPASAWVWNRDIDGSFGMWKPDTGWEDWSGAFFDC